MSTDLVRRQALEGLGYTDRQAQFLVLVALHGGHFLRRQFVTFTGRGHGLAAVRFLDHVIARGHVRALPYGRRGHVYHLHARPLYAAIGEEHNRNRRVAEWDAVTRKLMTLDFVLAHPMASVWATEDQKVALLRERGVLPSLWPARVYTSRRPGTPPTIRYFVDKMPWYQEAASDTRLWIAYVNAERTLNGFDTFIGQYRALLSAVPSGVTYVAPTVWRGAVEAAFTKAMASGTSRDVNLRTFLDYCRLRRDVQAERWAAVSGADIQRYHGLQARYASASFRALFVRWLRAGDSAIRALDVDAAVRPDCAFRVHALGLRYDPGVRRPSP